MKNTKQTIGIALLALSCAAPQMHAQLNYFSDFNDGIPDWVWGPSMGTAAETNGQLSIRAQFPATDNQLANSLTSAGWSANHPILDGQTLEYRVDLIEASRPDVLAAIDYNATGISGEGLYAFFKDGNQLILSKHILGGVARARFFVDAISVKHHDVTLSMALTGVGSSVRITCRVLDLDAGGAVLFERTVLDTPGVDPTVPAPPGMGTGTPDSGPPFGLTGSSGAFLYLAQVTDGNQPEVDVIYDNFTWEYRSAAELNIERAVRLSWPSFSTPFIVEGAPSMAGPWTPVNEPVLQTNGMNWVTVPTPLSQTMQVFRLSEVTP